MNNLRISECKTRVLSVEEQVQLQNNSISKSVNNQEKKLNLLKQVNQWQKILTSANQITDLYKVVDGMNILIKFFRNENDNLIHFQSQ